jgi:hypothetical protein
LQVQEEAMTYVKAGLMLLAAMSISASSSDRASAEGGVEISAASRVQAKSVKTSSVKVNKNVKVNVNKNVKVNVNKKVVVRPVRGWAHKPYYGTVIGGIALGTVIAATAAGAVPVAPGPNMCWYWSDPSMTRGYWDYCVAP